MCVLLLPKLRKGISAASPGAALRGLRANFRAGRTCLHPQGLCRMHSPSTAGKCPFESVSASVIRVYQDVLAFAGVLRFDFLSGLQHACNASSFLISTSLPATCPIAPPPPSLQKLALPMHHASPSCVTDPPLTPPPP